VAATGTQCDFEVKAYMAVIGGPSPGDSNLVRNLVNDGRSSWHSYVAVLRMIELEQCEPGNMILTSSYVAFLYLSVGITAAST
jgi:hypothetical protein